MITIKASFVAVAALAGFCIAHGSIAAVQTPSVDVTLNVARAGTGSGTVTSDSGPINCGATCSAPYPAGTNIVLTAMPAAGSQFMGWLGPCIGSGTCQITLNVATTALATFAPPSFGPPTLDIDGNTTSDALTDGLLVIRYLFGLTGTSLINNALGTGASRNTPNSVADYIVNILPTLDFDGNGKADALTDGLLIIRYLFGLRGQTLIAGVIGSGAQHTTAAELEPLIQGVIDAAANVLPPDPVSVAPPLDPSTTTSLAAATSFLYAGPNAIQTGVAAGTIDARRIAVLRGNVSKLDDTPLPGVKITVVAHPEFGQTRSRQDGAFDLAVNGGGVLTVNYEKTGYLPVQRQLSVPWQDYAQLPHVAMIPLDAAVTPINWRRPRCKSRAGRSRPMPTGAVARRC